MNMINHNGKLKTEHEVATLLNIKVTTLRSWRTKGLKDLPFVRVGRCIRYDPGDVDDYIERNKFISTTEAEA